MASLPYKIKKHNLTICFTLVIVIFLSVGIITIKGLHTLGNLTRTIYEHPLSVSNASLSAALNITKMHRNMKDVVLANSPDEIQATLQAVEKDELKVYQQLDTIKKDILGKEGQILEEQTRQLFINWKPIREDVIRLLTSGNKPGAILITKSKGADHVAKLEAKMLELTSYAREKAGNFLELAETSRSRLENITVILTLAGVLISVLIAFIATYVVANAEKRLVNEKIKLQKALDEIKSLRGILPLCSFCNKIRDDKGYWERVDVYLNRHSDADISHSICPECMKKHYPDEYASIYPDKNKK